MATTWNPSDKAAGITLSGGNLVATNSNNAICGVRGVHRQISGKFYWEVAYNIVTYTFDCAGIISSAAARDTALTGQPIGAACCGVQASNGAIGGGITGAPALGAITAGTVVCFAVDVTNGLFWARSGAAGNWNASAANNPATGVGGVSIRNIFGVSAVYAWCLVGNTNDQMTANFGDSAFAGTPPSGYVGFSATTPPLIAANTLSAIEQWAMPNAAAQATSVALEMWAPGGATTPRAVATLVSLEMWAQGVMGPTTAPQTRVMILA